MLRTDYEISSSMVCGGEIWDEERFRFGMMKYFIQHQNYYITLTTFHS